MRAPGNSEQSFVQHGHGRYPYVNRLQCRTCCSRHRRKIERLYTEGVPISQIMRRLPKDDQPSQQSVKRHFQRGHLAVDSKLVARRAQVRAEKQWQEIGCAATIFTATEVEVQQMVVEILTARIATGELKLDAKTLLNAIRFVHDAEREDREAIRLQRGAEQSAATYAQALSGLMKGILEVGGEHVAHDAIAKARKNAGIGHDLLNLPSLEWAMRWHIDYVNSIRFEDYQRACDPSAPRGRWRPETEVAA